MIKINRIFCLFAFSLILPVNAMAGFLEMPEITEMPEFERKSMLKDLDIPSVRDRDPDPESGPRLNVERFKLQGIVEYPELGISKADIEKLIDGIRFDLMDEYRVEESGFTATELEEVSQLLVEIEEDTMERHVSDLEVQKLVWLIREQRSKRGITLGQIETVADRITQFYRKRGFILARAYIPEQEVRDGVVTLTLLLGTLGEVLVHDNALYSNEYLASAFDNMILKPVTSSVVEENLYLINDFPGVSGTGYFEPGAQVGDTRLNLNVKAEKSYAANVRLDNHGSEQTGLNRLYGEILWNNLAGNADQLHLAVLATGNPGNTTYGQIRYSSRIFSPRFTLSGGISKNDFVIGPGNSEAVNNLELSGETTQADLTSSYSIKRSRTSSYYAELGVERIESVLRAGVIPGDDFLDDIVTSAFSVFIFDVLDEENKMLHQGNVRLTAGRFEKGVDAGQDEQYNILNVDYSLLTFWKVPFTDVSSRVIYRASMQYASSPLTSIYQYSLAGPTKARGYPVNQFSADNAAFMAVDVVFNAPDFFDITYGGINFREISSPFLFLDASWGQVLSLNEIEPDDSAQLYDAGFGLQFAYRNKFHGNLQFAFPLSEKFSSNEFQAPGDTVKLVFDFQYSF